MVTRRTGEKGKSIMVMEEIEGVKRLSTLRSEV